VSQKTITRTVRNDAEKQYLMRYIAGTDGVLTVTIKPGEESRSQRQNRLAFRWFKDASEQGDQTAEQYRAECKLRLGVPILRRDSDHFQSVYDDVIRPHSYEKKLIIMEYLPVTRLFSVAQMTEFLEAVQFHFSNQGFLLTDPSLLGMENYREWQ
jgi:hypothetical protein